MFDEQPTAQDVEIHRLERRCGELEKIYKAAWLVRDTKGFHTKHVAAVDELIDSLNLFDSIRNALAAKGEGKEME